ncbi:hypothetical protein IWW55_000023 [Coemansia sp. RSA 2706]|nr:hypothetical protein LPJ63_000492 [Coemansia sp. RSA 2711]KAJ1845300.1 hypothetical protein LPJ70_002564 [Coemansia sp. RSA 2708]KAJ2309052.1 hypothetical protein IWW55_000023 [Coemansia sp. RSA 2706]KAJ2315780.1 hypothetical protein IWW54_000021 [Coemansia sp. RSA 2705]KAJ2322486.1 hypothetical protein IWW52_000021 [Coemansia sp. RSA 2704]KAJ2330266.1 hypothetical protein IWW51_000021 [Coemansia sp. RSA 2702]KAJ2740027.1 hypothetical protein H4R23_000021 [Coemansia sp. Cherry 401B]
MRLCTLALPVVLLAATTHAHTSLFYVGADGAYGKQDQYLIPSSYGNAPVKDLSSPDLRCRSKTIEPGSVEKLGLTAGGTLSIQWQHIHNSVKIPVMSLSHIGPCLVYVSPLASNGEGAVWHKIFAEGYDASAKQWCTTKVIKNNGKLDVPIPAGLPNGDYLIRTELFALHQAKALGMAQLYPNCAVATVSGGQGTTLPDGVAIPGVYNAKDPGILYDRSGDPTKYEIPGPPLFDGSAGGSGSSNSTSSQTNSQPPPSSVVTTNPPTTSGKSCLKPRGKTSRKRANRNQRTKL